MVFSLLSCSCTSVIVPCVIDVHTICFVYISNSRPSRKLANADEASVITEIVMYVYVCMYVCMFSMFDKKENNRWSDLFR